MGIFEALLMDRSNFRDGRNDLMQFVAGAAFGGMFLYWAVWTWNLMIVA